MIARLAALCLMLVALATPAAAQDDTPPQDQIDAMLRDRGLTDVRRADIFKYGPPWMVMIDYSPQQIEPDICEYNATTALVSYRGNDPTMDLSASVQEATLASCDTVRGGKQHIVVLGETGSIDSKALVLAVHVLRDLVGRNAADAPLRTRFEKPRLRRVLALAQLGEVEEITAHGRTVTAYLETPALREGLLGVRIKTRAGVATSVYVFRQIEPLED